MSLHLSTSSGSTTFKIFLIVAEVVCVPNWSCVCSFIDEGHFFPGDLLHLQSTDLSLGEEVMTRADDISKQRLEAHSRLL